MDRQAFEASLKDDAPPAAASTPLKAMWHAAKDEWETAHGLAQSDDSAESAWVHAHLHRIEGDLDNAGYWYNRAGRPKSDAPLKDEWAEIVGALAGS